jgi:hypothetical protein
MDERERGASTERRSSLANRGADETLGLGEQREPPFHHTVGEQSPGSHLGAGVPYELGRLTGERAVGDRYPRDRGREWHSCAVRMHAPKVAGETASRLADRTARSLDVTAAVADSAGPSDRSTGRPRRPVAGLDDVGCASVRT